jgi:ubiquinone/menaquinone biosynthesis C-methylase UbiE
MTDRENCYDRIAERYERWWAPVLAPTARGLLDTIASRVEGGARRVLDIGTGTGTLAVAAVNRWPSIEIDGIDASKGMVSVAEASAERTLPPESRRRLRLVTAYAHDLPFDTGTFDVAISSFVLQLVPNRIRVLREASRVLRPGGTLAYVTWLDGGWSFEPDVVLDEVLDEVGLGAREPDDGGRDIASPEAAAAQLRRAGFRRVTARKHRLEYAFDSASYLGFLAEFDEEDLFTSLESDVRTRLVARLCERWAALSPEAFVLRLPVVTVVGTRM